MTKWTITISEQNGDHEHTAMFFGPIENLIQMLMNMGWKVGEIQKAE